MAISNRIQASHTGNNPSLEEIKEQWDQYGNQALALINVSPTELAIENSNVTKRGEDENRITLYNMGLDLQHVDDERLRPLTDGHYMIAVKDAFKRGAYSQGKTSDSSACSTMPNESIARGTLKGVCTSFYAVVCSADSVTHSLSSCPLSQGKTSDSSAPKLLLQGKTLDSSACSTMSDESIASGTLKGVCTPFYTVVCSADSVTHSLSSCPFMFTRRARHRIALQLFRPQKSKSS